MPIGCSFKYFRKIAASCAASDSGPLLMLSMSQPKRSPSVRNASTQLLRCASRVKVATGRKIPYLLVVGDRELADDSVAVRRRHRKGQETLGVHEFQKKLEEEVETRGIS